MIKLRTKRQTVTADSLNVTEFIATHVVAKEFMWLRALLDKMSHAQLDSMVLGEDNMSTIAMINNYSNSKKSNHIEIRFNLIREQALRWTIQLEHLAT